MYLNNKHLFGSRFKNLIINKAEHNQATKLFRVRRLILVVYRFCWYPRVNSDYIASPTQSSYSSISRKEVHVRHLQIRFVSQGVVCVHSLPRVSIPSPLLFWVCWFRLPHGFTLYISLCV